MIALSCVVHVASEHSAQEHVLDTTFEGRIRKAFVKALCEVGPDTEARTVSSLRRVWDVKVIRTMVSATAWLVTRNQTR